jgi:hypothetical protein
MTHINGEDRQIEMPEEMKARLPSILLSELRGLDELRRGRS